MPLFPWSRPYVSAFPEEDRHFQRHRDWQEAAEDRRRRSLHLFSLRLSLCRSWSFTRHQAVPDPHYGNGAVAQLRWQSHRLKAFLTILVNGRISDRSFRGYLRFAWFFGPCLRRFSAICMQSQEDARRIIAIGALPNQVQVTRNLKYDISIPTRSPAGTHCAENCYGLPQNSMIFTAGSTHEGGREPVISAYKSALLTVKQSFWCWYPRHPERAFGRWPDCCRLPGFISAAFSPG